MTVWIVVDRHVGLLDTGLPDDAILSVHMSESTANAAAQSLREKCSDEANANINKHKAPIRWRDNDGDDWIVLTERYTTTPDMFADSVVVKELEVLP